MKEVGRKRLGLPTREMKQKRDAGFHSVTSSDLASMTPRQRLFIDRWNAPPV